MGRCRALGTSAFLLVTGIAPPASRSTARIYVTNSAGDNVDVVDPATNKVVQVIKGIEAPHGINFSPDGSRVYVSNEADSTLDVVDRKSGKVIVKVALSGHPNNIAVTEDGGRVVVGIAEDPGALDIIDTKALARTKSVPVRGRLHNVYVTPDGKTPGATGGRAAAVCSYSPPGRKVRGCGAPRALNGAGCAPTGALPGWSACSPDSKAVAGSNSGTRRLSAVGAGTLKVVKTIA